MFFFVSFYAIRIELCKKHYKGQEGENESDVIVGGPAAWDVVEESNDEASDEVPDHEEALGTNEIASEVIVDPSLGYRDQRQSSNTEE